MVTINEELEAAKQAQAVISTLSTSALNSDVVAAVRNATSVATNAITTFPGEAFLNDARAARNSVCITSLFSLFAIAILHESTERIFPDSAGSFRSFRSVGLYMYRRDSYPRTKAIVVNTHVN
jgi:hypothetical protein